MRTACGRDRSFSPPSGGYAVHEDFPSGQPRVAPGGCRGGGPSHDPARRPRLRRQRPHTVIDSVRNWVAGLLAALATLFLTIGGARYLTANGNPRAVEEGKAAIKSAMIGYVLAALSPMLVSILQKVLAT